MLAALMNPMLAGGYPGAGYSGYLGLEESMAMSRLGMPGMGMMGMPGMGMNPMMMMEQELMGELVGLLMGLMMNGMQQQQQAGQGGADASSGLGGGSGSGSGGADGSSSGGDVCMGSGTPNSGGAGAAQLANSLCGKAAGSLSFQNYSHAGGVTNDCADFVSAVVADTEGFHKSGGDANVTTFKNDLQKQGWVQVSKGQCMPGDVAIIEGNAHHTELCTQAGGAQFVGANGSATETVGKDNLNWASGVTYWHKPG